MKFSNTEEKKLFEKRIADFVKKHDRETLKALYKFSKELRQEFGLREFSVLHIYHGILIQELETVYRGKTLNEIAKLEKIPRRTIYNIFHKFHRKKKTR